MNRIDYTQEPDVQHSLRNVLLGFLGVSAAFLLLPKTLKYVVRKFVLGLISEVVAVVLTGLLTEKVVEWIGEEAHTNGQAAPRDVTRAAHMGER